MRTSKLTRADDIRPGDLLVCDEGMITIDQVWRPTNSKIQVEGHNADSGASWSGIFTITEAIRRHRTE